MAIMMMFTLPIGTSQDAVVSNEGGKQQRRVEEVRNEIKKMCQRVC